MIEILNSDNIDAIKTIVDEQLCKMEELKKACIDENIKTSSIGSKGGSKDE